MLINFDLILHRTSYLQDQALNNVYYLNAENEYDRYLNGDYETYCSISHTEVHVSETNIFRKISLVEQWFSTFFYKVSPFKDVF
jgi:hypothetical protein